LSLNQKDRATEVDVFDVKKTIRCWWNKAPTDDQARRRCLDAFDPLFQVRLQFEQSTF
jgi:hypothetical protein